MVEVVELSKKRAEVQLARKGKTSSSPADATIENLILILKAYQIKVRYNVIKKDFEITIPGKRFTTDNDSNCGFALLKSICETHHMPTKHIGDYLFPIGDENSYNPIKEWIEGEPWDGQSRLAEFYATIEAENKSLKETLLKRWMVSAVAALYEPDGVPAGGILVLQGEQYLGKTNWFNNLVSDHVKDCIKSGISIDPSDRDSKRTALSYWLVELGELIGSLQKKTQDPMKAFLTSNTDVFRLPYARADSRFKRRTVFCGTVNELKFLRDHTGNRRFFTIACQRINHTHGLDMQQIWAETKVLYDTGEKWFLSKEEFEELNVQNEEHELIDPLREKIDVLYEWEKYNPDDTSNRRLTATQVLEEMGYRNPSRGLTTSLGSILSTRIPTTGTKKLNGSRTYYMPALKNNPIADLWDRT